MRLYLPYDTKSAIMDVISIPLAPRGVPKIDLRHRCQAVFLTGSLRTDTGKFNQIIIINKKCLWLRVEIDRMVQKAEEALC